jgi:hypothetical protein
MPGFVRLISFAGTANRSNGRPILAPPSMSHQIYAKSSLLPVGLFALVGFGACQSVEYETSVQDLFQNGSYVEANALAADQAESAPDDERAGSIHEMTQVALHLEEGRQASYQGDLAGALISFFRADHVVPGHPVVAEWIEKTVSELVIQSMRKASESAALGNLDEATGHYEHALVFDPEHEVAKEGIARMLLLENHREGMGDEYYKKGMRAMRGFWLGQANADFQYNGKYAPGEERGELRRKEIGQLLAEDRALMAERLEEQGLLHAARNEYRLALLLVPDFELAREQFDRLEIEVEAAAKLREAERKTTRGELDAAEALLREGAKLSPAQRTDFQDAYNEVADERWRRLYDEGMDFELDSDFESAVLKYDELLQEAGAYNDAISRRKTCLGFVELAERLYGEAKASKEAAQRLRKYKQISVFWPEYLDVAARIEKLDSE